MRGEGATKLTEQPLAATKEIRGRIRFSQDRGSHETHEKTRAEGAWVQAYSTGLPFVKFVGFVAKNQILARQKQLRNSQGSRWPRAERRGKEDAGSNGLYVLPISGLRTYKSQDIARKTRNGVIVVRKNTNWGSLECKPTALAFPS